MDSRKKRMICGVLGFIVLFSIVFYYSYSNKKNKLLTEKSAVSSLIDTQIIAVQSNTKPVQILSSIRPIIKSKNLDKKQANILADLAYTSTQNASLYYNNTNQLLVGEIDYNRGTSINSLDSGKNSAFMAGFIKDIEDQYLVANNLNSNFILSLPDFNKIKEFLGDSPDKDLSLLLEAGGKIQDLNILKDDKPNILKAIEGHKIAIEYLDKLQQQNPNSKYIQDLSSLARLNLEIAFSYIETNNLSSVSLEKYSVDKDYILILDQIIKEEKDGPIAEEAAIWLSKIDSEGHIDKSFLKGRQEHFAKLFGSNVYWQTVSDITRLVQQQEIGGE